MTGEVVCRFSFRVGDTCGEQTVGYGLGVHVGEAVGVQIVHQCFLKCLHQLADATILGLNGESGLNAIADCSGQTGEVYGKGARCSNDFPIAQREGRAPLLSP